MPAEAIAVAPAAPPAAPAAPSLISTPPATPSAPAAPGAPIAPTPPPAPGTPQAPVVAKSWVEGWVRDGKIDKSAYDHLPDELKADRAMLERYDNPDDFIKSFVNHAKLARAKTLTPPPDNAPEADKQAFDKQVRQIFGVPEKPEGYNITKPAEIPDALWDGEYVSEMAKAFHAAAIPPKAVAAIVAANNKLQQANIAKLKTADEARINELAAQGNKKLNDEFGRDRSKMETLAINVAKSMGIPTEEGSEFNGSADMIRLAAKYAVAVGEDKFITGESKGAQQTPMGELNAMKSDPTNKYYAVLHDKNAHSAASPSNALWREAVRRIDELAKQSAAMQARK